jgi:hypothetical protein
MRNRFSFLLLCLALSAARTAAADDAEARRAAFEKGWDALEAKNYAEAYRILSALFAEKPAYDVALNLGAAEYQLAKYADAATHLSYGVRNAPPGESVETIERGKQGLERIKQRYVATLTVSVAQAGAEVRLDGKPVGKSPLDVELFANPGHHKLEALLDGYQPATREIDVNAGQALTVALDLGAPLSGSGAPAAYETRPPAPAEHSDTTARTVVLISGAALTAIAGTTAIIFGVKSSSAGDRADDITASLDEPCLTPGQSATCAELHDEIDDRNQSGKVANIALVVTAVAAVATGVTFFAWPKDDRKAAKAVRFQPTADLTGAGLMLNGRF